ncbi:ATPase (plasmid) [Bacillus velezensis]|uniref:VirB4 family type IV secretion system protein n=1 Tax=Bacillus TaxID=1386 RepID=UPI001E54574C|nr:MULTISPECIES: ATPase [Bacillus amyloliquefaciens group]MED2914209.1 ATPase [Bacillus velezensis]UFD97697.1 VirB4-like ATPase [Bacillus amyloliquefaciens]URJ76531.1 ATPase [Bacillus velezensis]URJ80537.1 ATPase [Bacillus velezensis]
MEEQIEKDLEFVYATQPMGGISFKDEFFNRTGDGYVACLRVYGYPDNFRPYWLNKLTSMHNTIVTIDTYTPKDIDYVKSVKDSTTEMRSRMDNAKSQTDYDLAAEEFQSLRELGIALNNAGEVIKQITVRIFLHGDTQQELEKRVAEIQKQIDSDGFKSKVFLDENKEEWQSLFLDYETQLSLPNKRVGYDMPAEAIGLGFAYDQTSLNDPSGLYYGYTFTRGTVYWDLFHKTSKRLYYNMFVSGDMGSGKSTLLKKILRDNAAKGNFIRGFDKSGEFHAVTADQGGKTIELDGSNGRINLMQIFPTVTVQQEGDIKIDEGGSFRQHVSKLNSCYRILNPKASDSTLDQFDELVYAFYERLNFWGADARENITQLPAEDYPLLSDFQSYCEERYQNEKDPHFKERIGSINIALKNLVNQYGEIFDGITSIPDMINEQIVFYDIGNISQLNDAVKDIQIFNALSQIWGNMMTIGRKSKEAFDKGTSNWWDITRFLIMLDECHNVLELRKAFTANFFVTLMSEARKFFGGLVLATQRIERMFPTTNTSDPEMALAANKLREIFGLTQYKALFKQDQTSMKLIKDIFEDQMTDNEYALLPKFETGDCILSIAGDRNLVMHVEATEEELELFEGGA